MQKRVATTRLPFDAGLALGFFARWTGVTLHLAWKSNGWITSCRCDGHDGVRGDTLNATTKLRIAMWLGTAGLLAGLVFFGYVFFAAG
ncbi:MAG: hypothetical protein H6727_18795 [Myxococcales bacterium]|nr:hypothetical protein [Myxococcales bacterium]